MQGSPLSICPALNISWNDLRLHCLDRQRSTLLYRDEKRSFHDMLRATPNARVPPCHLGDSECRAPPLQFAPPLTSHGMICDYIVWIDRDLHSLYRDEKISFHDMLRATPNARVPPCHLGDSECKAPPLQFVPPLTSHGMICDYIVWIDRDLHSYIEMKRDHFMTC